MNNIQWYPGHMTKTRRMMEENISLVDIVIELVDARIPYSSKNPDIDNLAKNKYRIIVMNKSDLADEKATSALVKYFEDKGYEVFLINALSGEGLPELMERAYYYVENFEPEPEATDDTVVYEAKPDVEFVITRGDDAAFYITGKRIERLVAMTNLSDDQSLRRFQRIWRFMELDAKLKEKGCKDGDEVVIGDQRFTFQE